MDAKRSADRSLLALYDYTQEVARFKQVNTQTCGDHNEFLIEWHGSRQGIMGIRV